MYRMILAAVALLVVPTTIARAQCPVGDVTLETQTEVDAFPSDCLDLTGDLLIVQANPTADPIVDLTPLANLETIGGRLEIQCPMLTTASFPSLTSAASIFLDDFLAVQPNSSLSSLAFPSLTSVGGDIFIDSVSGLTDLDLSSLTTVGNLALNFLPLNDLDLSSLTSVDTQLVLRGNSMTSLDLSMLGSVGDLFYFVTNNALTELDVPLLASAAQVAIQGNNSLTGLELPSLSSADFLTVSGNASLSTCCSLQNILTILDPGQVNLSNNAPGCNSLEEIRSVCSLVVPTLGTWTLFLFVGLLAVSGGFMVSRLHAGG